MFNEKSIHVRLLNLISRTIAYKIQKMRSKNYLMQNNPLQEFEFEKLSHQYEKLNNADKSFGVSTLWSKLEKNIYFESFPLKIDFLHDKTLSSVFGKGHPDFNLEKMLNEIVINFKSNYQLIEELLVENLPGLPLLFRNPIAVNNKQIRTSANKLTHLWQLSLIYSSLQNHVGNHPPRLDYLVEWGGGYGGLAYLCKKIWPQCTIVIIDLPIVCQIQAIYLESLINGSTYIINQESDALSENKINLINTNLLNTGDGGFITENSKDNSNNKILNMLKYKKPDFFVSAWALTESSIESQKFVEVNRYFDSAFGFIAYQDHNKTHEASLYTSKKLTENGKIIVKDVVPLFNVISEKYICWQN